MAPRDIIRGAEDAIRLLNNPGTIWICNLVPQTWVKVVYCRRPAVAVPAARDKRSTGNGNRRGHNWALPWRYSLILVLFVGLGIGDLTATKFADRLYP